MITFEEDQSIPAFALLLDDCGPYSSKDDMFLPWTLWRSGLALTCKKTLLLEVKEVLNNSGTEASVKDRLSVQSRSLCQYSWLGHSDKTAQLTG